MKKRNRIVDVVFVLIAIIFSAIPQCRSALSDKRLCFDPDCSEPISLAKTVLAYTANEDGMLSFNINVDVTVYSKGAGNRTDLWGVEINGRHGYVPKRFLKEVRVLKPELRHEVPTKLLSNNNNESKRHQSKKVTDKLKPVTRNDKTSNKKSDFKSVEQLPHSVTPPYETIDGTRLPVDHNESSIQQSPVTEVLQTKVVPSEEDVLVHLGADSTSKENDIIFTNTETPPEKDLNGEVVNDDQNISQKDDVNNLVKSSKETLDLPEINGIKIPSLDLSANIKNYFYRNVKQNTEQIAEEKVTGSESVYSSKEQSVPEVKDVQSSEEQSVPEVKDVESSKEQSVLEVKDVQSSKEQSVPEVKDVESSKEQSVPEVKDVESSKEQSVPEVKDVESSKKHSVPEVKDVESSKEQSVPEVKDVESSKKQPVPDIKDIQPLEEHIGPKKQDEQALDEHSVPKEKDMQLSGGQSVIEIKDTQSLEEHIISKGQNIQLPVIALNETDNTNSIQTVSVNSSEIDAKAAQNVSELTGTEHVHSLDNTTLLETSPELRKNDKASENSSIHHNVDHVPSLSMESDTTQNLNKDTGISVITDAENNTKELQEISETDIKNEAQYSTDKHTNTTVNEPAIVDNTVESNVDKEVPNLNNNSDSTEVPHGSNEHHLSEIDESNLNPTELLYSNEKSIISENVASINEFRNRNLLNVDTGEQYEIVENVIIDQPEHIKNEDLPEQKDDARVLDKHLYESSYIVDSISVKEATSENILHTEQTVASPEVCAVDNIECSIKDNSQTDFIDNGEIFENIEGEVEVTNIANNYWMTFMYLIITAAATLVFSLGYYYIENMRRDGQLIARINNLEKELVVSTTESLMLKENLKITKDKLTCIEDESFGSNEMVVSLKADLEASQNAKAELEDQVYMLEKELENATEAGLELERMLREILSSDNEVNPLAQSVEDLQTRLNAQQVANESLTNALNLKTQELEFDKLENESLSAELASFKKKYEELEVELIRVTENLKLEVDNKNNVQQTLTDKVQELEMQIKEISIEKTTLQKELKHKEVETADLMEVINRLNSNLDLEKLYNVTHIKAEATTLLEERNELKIRLAEVEGAHNLLEEHMKVIKEEVFTLSEQCKAAEKEKKDAETRLEVLSSFFKEKEAQRQKEEAIWLQQQGEVVSTVERIQTMQAEIQNYKQQIEMLKREILDQEREYKNQISVLETKAHEQWVIARQVERRLEESKVEAGQLRNRLTLIEKNINDDPEAKLHRLEANGETATSPPLFIGAESSGSPIMFSGSSSVPPPPPPSYLHSLFPPYLPPPLPNASNVPPYEISQRPPPLGGRLSSPPPMPLHPPASSRYDNASSPTPMSPHLLPSFNHRLPPPPFGNDHIHGPPPPPLGSIMPAPLGTTHSWGEEPLTPLRNSGYHLSQRERVRNHKGSLHSSGESLDNLHHSSKA
ncbi:transport and golgi organization 1 isoform X2 [Nomia melanderi]|uniref:transport and golgi organization 1 isoform X2 n=1 Tax=Nomia melanderi TaxID=2448451 RepID=UPI003FCE2817